MILHLTANARLSASLKTQFAHQASKKVSLTPQVMTWSQYWTNWQQDALLCGELMQALNAQQQSLPRLISAFEATRQWEQLLEKHSPTPLLNLADTAKQLYQAWCLWLEYAQDQTLDAASEEWRLFEACRHDYQAWLSSQNWVDEAALMQQRLHWFQQGIGRCPTQVEWHGFDELTPYMQAWQTASAARGAQHIVHGLEFAQVKTDQVQPSESPQADLFDTPPASVTSGAVQLYAAADAQDECQQVAAFCVDQLRQALAAGQPINQIRIGVVAPNLAQIKAPLSFWLDDQLFQAFESHPILANHSTERLYNLSLGTPLTQLAYVQYVQQSLKFALNPTQSVSYQDWSHWLTASFAPGERDARHALDSRLRKRQRAWVKWTELVEQTPDYPWPKPLQNLLRQMAQIKRQSACRREAFVEQVLAILELLDQAGPSLSSEVYQQRKKYRELLEQFANLQALQESCSLNEWLNLWQRYCAQSLHQAQSTWVQPIQIIGMLEAGGQPFDALWVMGLDDEAWPRPSQPNVFLPLAWQRQRGLPRCDAQRELAYARLITQRLLASAPKVVLSYAQQKGEALAMPSPLLAEYTDHYEAKQQVSSAYQAWLQKPNSDWVEDCSAPPIAAGETVPGGSGVLKAQASCPLMAFMDYRLGAKYGLETVEDGLASTDQGRMIHRVLQLFWQAVKTQSALLAMDAETIEQKLAQCLDEVFEPIKQGFAEAYLAQEQQRMLALLQDWIGLEQARPLGFEVVETEKEMTLTLAGIGFKISIDRIDKTEQGAVLIDYKTGRASVNDLLSEPIRAPQLAVYLHGVDAPITGLGYGLLSSDKGASWNLLSEQAGLVSGGEKNWEKIAEKDAWLDVPWSDFIQFLQQQVTELAQGLQQGYAPMIYQKETDLIYSPALLALRLPEVKAQNAALDDEPSEWEGEA